MSILEQTFAGSYKGVNFLMTSGTVAGGPKVVKHEYPNSDIQTIETLGKTPRSYSVSILIGGGDNYLARRDQILRVLEQDTLGKLVHPLYGNIENVIALPYTLTENFNSLGEGRISVVFEISEGTGVPIRTSNTLNTIENSNTDTLTSINSGFTGGYEIQANQPATYTDALDKGRTLGVSFSTNTKAANGLTNKIDSFNSQLNSFIANITSIINTPQAYVDDIQALFNTINSLYPTIGDTILVIERFFTFGNTDVNLNLSTPSRITRDTNRTLVNDMVKATALSYSYFNSSQLTFETVSDINKRADILEAQYKKIIVSDGLDEDTKRLLTQLRIDTRGFFEAEKLTAQQIVTVNTRLTTARLLAHAYYGNSDKGAQIAELNNVAEPSFIEGDVLILTA